MQRHVADGVDDDFHVADVDADDVFFKEFADAARFFHYALGIDG